MSPSRPGTEKSQRPAKKKTGTVAFIGAGPGDPGLLTLRAVELLGTADLVVADPSQHDLLRHAPADVEVVDGSGQDTAAVGKLLIAAAREGQQAVRVFSGDPTMFCGFSAEAEVVSKAKVRFELVPGISSAIAVPAYAGVPVAGRGAGEVHVVDIDPAAPEPDWPTLASATGTLVLLNVNGSLGKAAAALIEHGRRGDSPIAVTADGTTTAQQTVVATLDTVERDAAGLSDYLVAVIGDAVKLRDRLSWWETRPLFGWKVLVPRTREQAPALSAQLIGYGAVPVEVPTIAVEPPRTPQAMDRAIRALVEGRYAWLALTSTNAVRAIRDKVEELGLDARALAGTKVACVGDATAAAVRSWGISPDLVPTGEQSSEGLLGEWPEFEEGYGAPDRVFAPRADIATDALIAGLTERGWQVDDVTAYRTVRAAPPAADIREAIKTGGFDAVLFTSSSTVRNLVGIAGKPHSSSVIAVIGPRTADAAAEVGLRVDVSSPTPSVSALAEALADYGRQRRADGDALPPGKVNRVRLSSKAKRR